MKARLRFGTGLATLLMASMCQASLLEYKLEGDLILAGGDDTYGLGGSHFVQTFTVDPEFVTDFGASGLYGTVAYFLVTNISATFTNRPGGLPDLTAPGGPEGGNTYSRLTTDNNPTFDTTTSDRILVEPAEFSVLPLASNLTSGWDKFEYPRDFFANLGIPTLAPFTAGLEGYKVLNPWSNTARTVFYNQSNVSFSANAVPIPPAAWLLATGIAGLGGYRWTRRKVQS